VLEVENGTVMAFEGNYEDYLRKKEQLAAANAFSTSVISSTSGNRTSHPERSEAPAVPSKAPDGSGNGSRQGATSITDSLVSGQTIIIEGGPAKARRLNPIKQKQMEDRCAFLEEEVPRIEASLTHTEQQLGIFISAEETQRLTQLAEDLRTQRDTLTAEWEDLMLQLEP